GRTLARPRRRSRLSAGDRTGHGERGPRGDQGARPGLATGRGRRARALRPGRMGGLGPGAALVGSEAGPRGAVCGSDDVETVSAWGGTLITRQLRCRRCNTYFEAVRDELGGDGPSAEA